jgi:hypothetical protein
LIGWEEKKAQFSAPFFMVLCLSLEMGAWWITTS